MTTFLVNVDKDGYFVIHAAGCRDASDSRKNMHEEPWTKEAPDPVTAGAEEVMENYGFELGKPDDNDNTYDTNHAVCVGYGVRIFPCCKRQEKDK